MEEYELREIALQEGGSNLDINTPPNYDNPVGDGSSPPDSPDIQKSENQFKNVERELEIDSKQYLAGHDAENNHDENDEDFKLRRYFENSQRMALGNGQKPKKMGVSIRNLTVVGRGADQSVIADMSTPFIKFFNLFKPSTWKEKGSTFDILHDITLFNRDGGMLLVLGRPGSGCSTLLRLISNQRGSYVEVKGDITYGGIPAKEWKRYQGESIYTPEEDTHHPTLTVRQTLDFALKCKTIHNRLPDEKKRTYRKRIFDLLLGMFGIVHQADTIVGNEFIRGLSGGERKRLTITEAMVSSASITCYDCSTRGLDAASALDYAKSIRIMSDTLDKTTIASFYQASDSIYNLFDNVAVIEKGRLIYFGPGNKAKQYFIDLGFDCEPRKSTPDFLTGVTNPQERIIRQGFEGRVPETFADFEAAWRNSSMYRDMLEEQKEYERKIEIEQPAVDFIQEVKAEKSKTTSKRSIYTTSFLTQVKALIVRNFQIIWGDKLSLGSRYLSVFTQSFVYGSIFYNLETNINGLFTRGGTLFSVILFNALLCECEMPLTFGQRGILQKQHSYAMYRPSALHIAQIVTDIPLTIIQVFLFSIVVYFMFGLQYDAGKFFIFCFTLVGATLATTNLFRMFGNFSPSLYISQNVMNIFIISMITYTGYTIPKPKMHPWFSWFYWCNPFSYAFKALMANEFGDLSFDCQDTAIPSDPNKIIVYDNSYRICASPGASMGNLTVSGSKYIEESFHFRSDDLTQNVFILYLWWILYIVLNMFAMEYFDWTGGGYSHKVYKKGKAPKMNDVEEEKKQNQIVANATSKMKDTLKMRGGIFTWQNINYTVPVKGGKRLLLDNVEGWIKPGQMTALMGSSGAGKTTLLDVLAKRKTMGEVQGKCFLNGKPLEIDFERITGYVEQMDVHNPGLTVREALRFSAKLRQEPSVSLKEKFDYVEHVLEMMEMKHLGDALIGTLETGVGISVEERKRLTIGVELVAKPHILFLDEPTSGLDAQSSYNIVKFIRKLADAGMPLVCTIHQPSSVLFEHFDRILLLAKGGKTVYFGDIGERSKTLTSYFERYGVRPCTESENPAEYILEATGAGVHGKSDVNWPETWKQSPELQEIERELAALEAAGPSSTEDHGKPREFATSVWYQTIEVYKRLNLIWWRDPFYTYGSFIQSALAGLIIGFTFWSLQGSSSDMNQRVFFIFEALILGILLIFVVLPQFIMQKEYFKRDFASKFYSWFPFAISIVGGELPFITVSGTIFFFCSFWTAGLNTEYNDINFYFWFIFILFLYFCVSFGQAVAAICFNMFLAHTLIPLLIVFLFLFCGVMVIPSSIPTFWRGWVYHLNPCRYFMEGIVTNVLKHTDVKCTSEDFTHFTNPEAVNGVTCKQYFPISEPLTGYVEAINEGDESKCGYCLYNNGEEYYNTLGWSFDNRWRNLALIICFWIFNTLMVITFVYITRKPRR
uniref:ABC transporter AbcG13 n=1 Tax=Dictyostelium discoideum TaxID=44689 RepID=Q8T680_DICDI|nr:ABC transporter AbcG13 [Dictyostelium discoideum]